MIVAFTVIVLLYVASRFDFRLGAATIHSRPRFGAYGSAPWTGDVILLLIIVAGYWLTEALREITGGGLFTSSVVRRFRLFASWLLAAALFGFFAPLIPTGAAPPAGPYRRVLLIVDIRDLLLIGVTLLLLLVARMFERARLIDEENREII